MLSGKFRASRRDIEETLKKGKNISGSLLFAKVSKEESEKPAFAIVVSKKNEKTSVGRHKIKRKISSFLEKELLKTKPKRIILFFLKNSDGTIDYEKVEKDIRYILEEADF